MNKDRRKEISKAVELMNNASGMLEEAKDILDCALSDEQDYLDNMPENLQGSEKYEVAESAVANLEEAVDAFDEIIDGIGNIVDSAEAASE